MKTICYIFILIVITTNSFGQKIDTAYVATYAQKMMVTAFLSNNTIELLENKKYYKPNNPLNVGVGFLLRNTALNVRFQYGLIPIRSKEFGKTRSIDIQAHRYGRRFLLDLFFQKYKGFYEEKEAIALHPDISVRQIGAEGTYLFNGKKFSAKAAFEQSEKQLRSVGSFLLGGGIYWYKIAQGKDLSASDNTPIHNLQLGMNAGYAYSWVINDRWLMSGMATGGINFGNNPDLLKEGKIEAYPTAFARGSASYHKSDWAASFLFLINNKSVRSSLGNPLHLTSVNMQVSYVKNFNSFFKKRK
jgi:hypothetical protein